MKKSGMRVAAWVVGIGMLSVGAGVKAEDSSPVTFKAGDVLPEAWLAGPNYQVMETVLNDGLIYTYTLQTDYGPTTVESTAMLLKRLTELRALDQIEKLKKTKTFTEALKGAGKAPFQTAQNLIEEPVDTVKGIGTGIGRWFKDVGRSIVSDDPHQPNALKTAVGQAPVLRQFAYEFKVDPYSSYEPLQKELAGVSWTATGGGLTTKLAFSAIGGAAGTALSVGGTAKGMREMVRDKSPAELAKVAEEELTKLGVSPPVIERFLANAAFNPQERMLLVGELVAMKRVENIAAFLTSAVSATDDTVAMYMRVRAQMLGRYAAEHEGVRLVEAGRVPFLQEDDGSVVGFFPLDHVRWTPEVRERLIEITTDAKDLPGVTARQMVLLGTVDADTGKVMKGLGWDVSTSQLEQLVNAVNQP